MKLNLLGGVALALVIGASSSAWANPKNSFADNNNITVNSNASASAHAGDSNFVGRDCNGTGQCGSNSVNTASASAWSEAFNTSIEGVDHQILSASTSSNFQTASASLGAGNDNSGSASASITDGGASASNTGPGLSVAAAAAGNGNLNLQAVSIGAGANVSF